MNPELSTALPPTIRESIAILHRGAESVQAVMTSEENRFSRALADLRRLSLNESIPIAIVGELCAIRYGYPAATQDIDVAIARDRLDAFVAAAPAFGCKLSWNAPSGWHTLTHGDVVIKVVPEGAKAKNSSPTTIPGPKELGVERGLEYASLSGWIELKLSAGRQKDRAHVVEVMKRSDEEALSVARRHIASVHTSYLELFDRLLEEAREERRQEDERRG